MTGDAHLVDQRTMFLLLLITFTCSLIAAHWRRATLLCAVPLLLGSTQPSRSLEQKLLDAALAQPRAWYENGVDTPGARETQEEYEQRIALAVRALSHATMRERKDGTHATIPPDWWWHRKTLVAAVLTQWYEESRLAYEVHAGIDHPVWTQDVGRARCFGQLHVGLVPQNEWEKLAGLDEEATARCALWTARALTRMALHCGRGKRGADKFEDILLPMFSAMGGHGCAPTVSGRAKVARFAKVWREIQKR